MNNQTASLYKSRVCFIWLLISVSDKSWWSIDFLPLGTMCVFNISTKELSQNKLNQKEKELQWVTILMTHTTEDIHIASKQWTFICKVNSKVRWCHLNPIVYFIRSFHKTASLHDCSVTNYSGQRLMWLNLTAKCTECHSDSDTLM